MLLAEEVCQSGIDSGVDQMPSYCSCREVLLDGLCLVQRILCTELLQRLTAFQPCLSRAVALAAEVDCLISLAQAARDHGYCRPTLTEDNVLHIKQGTYRSL